MLKPCALKKFQPPIATQVVFVPCAATRALTLSSTDMMHSLQKSSILPLVCREPCPLMVWLFATTHVVCVLLCSKTTTRTFLHFLYCELSSPKMGTQDFTLR